MKNIMIASFAFLAGGFTAVLATNILVKPVPIEVVPYEGTQQPYLEEFIASPNPPQRETLLPQRQQKSKIVVARTNETVKTTNDPIWEVQLIVNDKVVETLPALIGRASKQTANRHIAGNKSPLPIGRYVITTSEISGAPFDDPEVGKGHWIPIEPTFSTGRSVLGIHHDPSWGKTNGESGTSGCIGLKSAQDTNTVVSWIRQYNIREVMVKS
tara:strand:+ start:799 stop:1437 length:639 start_codon:yes stop_codon:yes gene_type:complete